jgi:hypothetical protein
MQPTVEEIVALGRLPDSAGASVEALQRLEDLFRRIRTPLTNDEARALMGGFGTDDCFGMAWSLLHAIETAPGWPLADVLGNIDNEWIERLRVRSSI